MQGGRAPHCLLAFLMHAFPASLAATRAMTSVENDKTDEEHLDECNGEQEPNGVAEPKANARKKKVISNSLPMFDHFVNM